MSIKSRKGDLAAKDKASLVVVALTAVIFVYAATGMTF